LLFVNISIGGTLTHFAAPPVLMVARIWGWNTLFMLDHFGWRALVSVVVANTFYFLVFRRELKSLSERVPPVEIEQPDEAAPSEQHVPLPVPAWLTTAHIAFMIWTIINAHYPALFVGGFFFFLGFARTTAAYQSRIDLRAPLLVGFFLAGLVIHGSLQGWWIAPVLASLDRTALFGGAAVLTAFNDNALITYLATLVPNFDQAMRIAVVSGAVVGGGLTVIANAPNPAGQALLSRFFDGAVMPARLFLGALIPTLIAAATFMI
jgi:Na+/H+ antiporter NhaD/arsenite permease-like protein